MADIPSLGTSERAAFKKCVFRWNLEYRMGYQPKFRQADALWFGIGVHESLAAWYLKGKRRGPHPADTFETWVGDEIAFAKTYLTDTFDEPVWEDAAELGISMLEAYVNHWGKDPQWSIISIEQPFSIKINRGGKTVAIFRSRWDGVFRDLADGRILLLETKTASQVYTAYLEHDDQAGSYYAAASHVLRAKGILKPKEEIAGVQYNFLRKAMPDERPRNEQDQCLNKDGSVSKKQPTALFVRPEAIERTRGEQNTQLARIADEVAWMDAVRGGTLPVTKTPTKDCPRCPFDVPCQLHERGNPAWKEIMKAEFRQADPNEDNRKSASGGS